MKTSESIDKVAPALLNAQSEAMRVGKSGSNQAQRYKYAKLEDYYEVCRSVFHDNNIFIVESVTGCEQLEPRVTSNGNKQYASSVTLTLTMIHVSGQWISIDSTGEGQDFGDKGIYKALTGARKYAIAMAANLVTSDDPEKDTKEPANSKNDKDNRPRAASPEPTTDSRTTDYEGNI